MRYLVIVLCLLAGSCTADGGTADPSSVSGASTLTPGECDRLVRRAYANMLFSRNSASHAVSESPLAAGLIASCKAGKGVFKRSYFDCVFAARYSNPMDCASAAKGVDRSKSDPVLAARETGDDGTFESAATRAMATLYRGQDPHTSIDRFTRKSFLNKRDNVYRSLGEVPPADHGAPLSAGSLTRVGANGQTYWVVREDFTELQLLRIMHENTAGTDSVTCARYGSSRRLSVDRGFCAAMINKYLHTHLPP